MTVTAALAGRRHQEDHHRRAFTRTSSRTSRRRATRGRSST
jgi:hypothetical protein